MRRLILPALIATLLAPAAQAQSGERPEVANAAAAVRQNVVNWRRDFHQNPELSNRETRTAAEVAKQLRALGLKPITGIAHHGVVAIIEGGKPGPKVALRADMDALPVTEQVDLPFASKVTTALSRRNRRRHARLRPRRPYRHPARHRQGAGADEGRPAGLGDAGVPAFRGRRARRRGRRRLADAEGRPVQGLQARCGVRPARVLDLAGRPDRRAPGSADGGVRQVHHQGEGPADARLATVGRHRSDRRRGRRDRQRAEHRQPPHRHRQTAGGGQLRRDQGRHPLQHHSRRGRTGRHHPHLRRRHAAEDLHRPEERRRARQPPPMAPPPRPACPIATATRSPTTTRR